MVRGGSTLPERVRAWAEQEGFPPDSLGTQGGGWGHGQPSRDTSWAWHSAAGFSEQDHGKEGIKSGQGREGERIKNGGSKNIPGGSLASLPPTSREEQEEERDKTKGTREERAKTTLTRGLGGPKQAGLGQAPSQSPSALEDPGVLQKTLPFYGQARRAEHRICPTKGKHLLLRVCKENTHSEYRQALKGRLKYCCSC